MYKDYKTLDEFPTSLTDDDGKPLEYFIQSVNSREKINEFVSEVFTKKEIQDMKGRSFYIQLLASSSGKIYSASLLFLHGEPKVDVEKFVQLSNQVKENITLTVDFNESAVNEGLVGWTYRVFPFQE